MRVVVGRIGRPHGIRGEVTVEPRTDEPDERFAPGSVLRVDGPVRQLTVDRAHWHSGRLLIAFDGIVDRNAAESLRGLLLEVERADDATPDDPSAPMSCAAGPPSRRPGGASPHPPAMTALLSPAASANENSLSAEDFARVRAMIHRHAGISLHEGKQAMVYSRLSRRLRDTGHPSFTSYLDDLENGGSESEWQQFVNCLTTNLTSFFREAHHFDALAQFLRSHRGQPLRGWCNAASTGEEPYSIAMTIAETLGPDAPVELMCSDIDTEVLGRAQRAVYPADARGLSPDRLKRHFLRGKGHNEGYIRVKPELARRVQFRTFNLVTTRWSELGSPFDFVFCRNVMIYFDPPTQRQLLQRIHAAMKPQGLLCVGHSENLGSVRELFKLRGQTTYERI